MLAAGSISLPSPVPALRPGLAAGASRLVEPHLVEPRGLPARRCGAGGGLATALACGSLLAAALWMAPEAPQDQAAICQRHNGVAACRVW